MSRRLGRPVGEHRALRIVRRLEQKGVIVRAGSYRQRTGLFPGWRVPLFRLRRTSPRQVLSLCARGKRCEPWWKHPLFGLGVESWPDYLPERLKRGRPPPGERTECARIGP
jgi:hypothetical protein